MKTEQDDLYCGGSKPAFPSMKTFKSSINWKEPTKDPYSGAYRFQTLEEVLTTGRSKSCLNPVKP